MSNLQANSRAPEGGTDNLEAGPRRRRLRAIQVRLTEGELLTIQEAAARWAAGSQPARPRRRAKSAASPPVAAGEQPPPPRRYSAVPRFLRAMALALARQGAAATTAPVGDEARAKLDEMAAFRFEVRAVGVLLNQAMRIAHTWDAAGASPGLVAAIDKTTITLGRILEVVEE